ncbi:hypothetical protein LZ575_19765 [Antarcticibacterium sp. 1MA-6-2]|uniref:hypothetical protein n=1 Tax=Antarcticibacterium sp. 1MA-6-2 TaxID=2908210 RepID=UPI001F265AA9|nr:hypothetical protein [Antarcticibacterium sp. 1MA-6-2]UJH90911.1 hypothetical protein LZ575_19765 [Antarcticibacterium sp. 1MA-6-2]
MKIIIYKFILAFISTCGISQAQEFEVPQQVKLETADDYREYQPTVLAKHHLAGKYSC